MCDARWFYRDESESEWVALAARLKVTACPHCQVTGTLIRHGTLTGYDDTSPQRKACGPGGCFAAIATAGQAVGGPSASGWPTESDG